MTQPQVGTAPGSNSNLYRNLLIGLVGLIVVGLIVGVVVVLTGSDDRRVSVGAYRADLVRGCRSVRTRTGWHAMKRFRRCSRPAR